MRLIGLLARVAFMNLISLTRYVDELLAQEYHNSVILTWASICIGCREACLSGATIDM